MSFLESTGAKAAAIGAIAVILIPVGSGLYKIMHLDDVERIECNTLVPRIVNAMNVRCEALHVGNNPTSIEMEIIEPLRSRYAEVCNREFSYGTCKDGKRISSYAVPGS